MALWHIMIPSRGPTIMEELKNACDFLAKLGHKQTEIDRDVERVAAAHDDLSARQAEFGPLMRQAEALMAANPNVEAVQCGPSDHVLVRLPSGAVTILPLSHWSELDVPESAERSNNGVPQELIAAWTAGEERSGRS